MPKINQAVLSFVIRILCIFIVGGLNAIAHAASGLSLPDAAVTVPLVGLAVSELDTWFVQYE